MENWKDNLTPEQLIKINEARSEAMKILARNKPLIKKLARMRKRFKKHWL